MSGWESAKSGFLGGVGLISGADWQWAEGRDGDSFVIPRFGLRLEIPGEARVSRKEFLDFPRDSGNLGPFAFLSLCFADRRSIDRRQSYSDSLARGLSWWGGSTGSLRDTRGRSLARDDTEQGEKGSRAQH